MRATQSSKAGKAGGEVPLRVPLCTAFNNSRTIRFGSFNSGRMYRADGQPILVAVDCTNGMVYFHDQARMIIGCFEYFETVMLSVMMVSDRMLESELMRVYDYGEGVGLRYLIESQLPGAVKSVIVSNVLQSISPFNRA